MSFNSIQNMIAETTYVQFTLLIKFLFNASSASQVTTDILSNSIKQALLSCNNIFTSVAVSETIYLTTITTTTRTTTSTTTTTTSTITIITTPTTSTSSTIKINASTTTTTTNTIINTPSTSTSSTIKTNSSTTTTTTITIINTPTTSTSSTFKTIASTKATTITTINTPTTIAIETTITTTTATSIMTRNTTLSFFTNLRNCSCTLYNGKINNNIFECCPCSKNDSSRIFPSLLNINGLFLKEPIEIIFYISLYYVLTPKMYSRRRRNDEDCYISSQKFENTCNNVSCTNLYELHSLLFNHTKSSVR